MEPLPHHGGLARDFPCTSSIRSTVAVCGMPLPKSDLPLSEGCGPSTEQARPNPAVPGTGSARDLAVLLIRRGDIRLSEDRMLVEVGFGCMVGRIRGVHWRKNRLSLNGMGDEAR